MKRRRDLAVSGLTGATAASRYADATVSGAPTGTFAAGDYNLDQGWRDLDLHGRTGHMDSAPQPEFRAGFRSLRSRVPGMEFRPGGLQRHHDG